MEESIHYLTSENPKLTKASVRLRPRPFTALQEIITKKKLSQSPHKQRSLIHMNTNTARCITEGAPHRLQTTFAPPQSIDTSYQPIIVSIAVI